MKNFILISALSICCLFAFFAFTDSGLEDLKASLYKTELKVAEQNECIDDLESSLYDFSTEITSLRAENAFLIDENHKIKNELKKYAIKAAELRSELTQLEIDNYNLDRQLNTLINVRELRTKRQFNPNVATKDSFMPSPDAEGLTEQESAEITEIAETQNKINEIQAALEHRNEALAKIEQSTQEAFTTIQNNEAKIQFNIDVEPMSNPTAEYSDPLISKKPLYQAPVEQPRLFSELEMVASDNHDITSIELKEDEFYSKSPVYSLVENTKVIYNYIACRNDRYGRKIKKLKSGAKNWKYTFLQFNLETENNNLLLDKQFRMRVLSTDLNTYLNFTTDKQPKPVSWYDFQYEGEPVKISLYNEDNIKGKSFDIQIFYIVDGEEYLLEDFQKSIFEDGLQSIGKIDSLADSM